MKTGIYISALFLLNILVLPPAISQNSAAKSYIFRTSNTQADVKQLGIKTVPAYVMIDNQRHDGLYITGKAASELGDMMKLAPGQVLLTLDGYRMSSATVAENWLARRGQKPLSYTCAVLQGGKPFIISGQVQAAAYSSANSSTGSSAQGSGQHSADELERYCISLINASRKQEGLPPCQQDAAMMRLAKTYSDYMKDHADSYDLTVTRSPHTDLEGRKPGDRARAAGITAPVLENIGRASRGSFVSDQKIVADLHADMMAEPKGQVNHRSTIMDPKCRAIGVGITRTGNRFYMVEEFSY